MRQSLRLMVLSGLALLGAASSSEGGQYVQTNLVSDLAAEAPVVDSNLKNPWGMSFSSTSPFWVSNQGSLTTTLYRALPSTAIVSPPSPVAIQGGTSPPTGATGQVFNSTTTTTSNFQIPAPNNTTVKSSFIFDTLNGTIQAWNPGSNNGAASAETVVTATGAVFTGLTLLATSNGPNYLFAADATGKIRVYDGTFTDVTNTTFSGKFVDPNPVPGFTPYNIQLLKDGNLYVTYAAVGPGGVPLPGGYVDKFDTAGNFLGRIATGGPINAPWGLAIAPSTFGQFANDLLVGNLYDSVINAYSLGATPTFQGSITVNTGFASPVGLWALAFGNGVTGDANTLYFTSGINDQNDGLFGSLSVPEPGSAVLLILGTATVALAGVARRHRRADRSTSRGTAA